MTVEASRRSKWLTHSAKPVSVEVYRTPADSGRHKETAHYAKWRDTVTVLRVAAAPQVHQRFP